MDITHENDPDSFVMTLPKNTSAVSNGDINVAPETITGANIKHGSQT
jgi:hypothetical protein